MTHRRRPDRARVTPTTLDCLSVRRRPALFVAGRGSSQDHAQQLDRRGTLVTVASSRSGVGGYYLARAMPTTAARIRVKRAAAPVVWVVDPCRSVRHFVQLARLVEPAALLA
jgi:hypothetical protein